MNLPSLSLTMLDGTPHNFKTFLKDKCAISSTEHSFVVGMKVAYFENQLIVGFLALNIKLIYFNYSINLCFDDNKSDFFLLTILLI